MGVLLKIYLFKIKCYLKEFKILCSNITKLLRRLINFLLYIIIIQILNTLKYFSYVFSALRVTLNLPWYLFFLVPLFVFLSWVCF